MKNRYHTNGRKTFTNWCTWITDMQILPISFGENLDWMEDWLNFNSFWSNCFHFTPQGSPQINLKKTQLQNCVYHLTEVYVKLLAHQYFKNLTVFHHSLIYQKCMLFPDTSPTYVYRFSHRLSVSPYPEWVRADHAMEMFFVLGDVYANRLPFLSDKERELSKELMQLWTNFARTGYRLTSLNLEFYLNIVNSQENEVFKSILIW